MAVPDFRLVGRAGSVFRLGQKSPKSGMTTTVCTVIFVNFTTQCIVGQCIMLSYVAVPEMDTSQMLQLDRVRSGNKIFRCS